MIFQLSCDISPFGYGLAPFMSIDFPSLSRLWYVASAANAPQRCCSAPPGLGLARGLEILDDLMPSQVSFCCNSSKRDQNAGLSDVIYIYIYSYIYIIQYIYNIISLSKRMVNSLLESCLAMEPGRVPDSLELLGFSSARHYTQININ